MKDYIKKLFTNNGVARGWLYIIIALAATVGDDLWALGEWLIANRDMLIAREIHWSVDIPIVFSLMGAKLLLAFVSVGNVIRAYLDQHLGDAKNRETKNEKFDTITPNP